MNEDKIRVELFNEFAATHLRHNAVHHQLANDVWNTAWQAALSTRPDINQELVEALERVDEFFEAQGKHIEDYCGGVHTHPMVKQALAKHKAGDAGFTEEYLVNKIMEELPSFSIAIHNPDDVTNYKYAMNISKNIIHALKAAGALHLRGEKK